MKKLLLVVGLMVANIVNADVATDMESKMYVIGLYDGCSAVLLTNHLQTNARINELAVNDSLMRCKGIVISSPGYKQLSPANRDNVDLVMEKIRTSRVESVRR